MARRTGGMVIVSHDRAFLDRTVTDVLELRRAHPDRAALRRRLGGVPGRARRRPGPRRRAPTPSTRRSAPSCAGGPSASASGPPRASPGRRSTRATTTRRSANFRINRTEKLAGRARRTERALDSLEVVEKPWEGWDLRFTINEAARSGDGRRPPGGGGDRARRLHASARFTLDIAWADRVALVGPNGSGKTTLVEALLGRLPLSAGTRRMGPSVVVGELAQDRRVLGDHPDLADAFTAATGLPPRSGPVAAGQVRAGRRRRAPSAVVALPRRAHPGRAGRVRRARRELPGARRADQPSRPARHRAAGVGAAGLRRHAPAGVARPAPARGGHHDAPRARCPDAHEASRGLRRS